MVLKAYSVICTFNFTYNFMKKVLIVIITLLISIVANAGLKEAGQGEVPADIKEQIK